MHTKLSTRNHKVLFVSILSAIILMFSSPGFDAAFVHAQEGTPPHRKLEAVTVLPEVPQEQGRYYSAKTFALSDGTLVTAHTINGPSVPPSGFEAERPAVALPQLNGLTANASDPNGGPLYSLGCSPTAAKYILKTDEGSDFPNIYPGILPPDGSWGIFIDNDNVPYTIHPLIATELTLEQRWDFYQSTAPDPEPDGQDLSFDQVGPFMRSSVYDLGDIDFDGILDHNYDGDTTFFTYSSSPCTTITALADGACPVSPRRFTTAKADSENLPDGLSGMEHFYEARGYKVAEAYNQPTDNVVAGGFSFAQFQDEIDADRPVMMHLGGESGQPGHSIVGIGYDSSTNLVYLHDGWDNDVHTMTWGGSYADMPLMMVSIIHPIPPDHPGDYTVSGYVGVPNATITFTGDSTTATITDSTHTAINSSGSTKASISGYYSFSVPPGWSGTVTPSKPGYIFDPPSWEYTNIPDYQTKQNYTATLIPNSNLIQDPSFESGIPNAYWGETSANFGTPLCNASCGAGARTGSVWGWFGGIPDNESATLSQVVTIPNGIASLDFYLWVGDETEAGSDTSDVFTVQVDNVTVFSANATQINSYPAYMPVSVDISAYANGLPHEIKFSSVTTGQVVSFHLDDIFLAVTSPLCTGCTAVEVRIASQLKGIYTIPVGGRVTPIYEGVNNGPVKVLGTSTVPIITSERAYRGLNYTDWNEMLGFPADQLTTEYWFPLYDTTGIAKTFISIGNTSPSTAAEVSVYIAGQFKGSYTIPVGGRVTPIYDGINNGPVQVISTNAVPIITSERAYRGPNYTDWNEMLGFPADQLTTEYWFPLYDTTGIAKTFISIGNASP